MNSLLDVWNECKTDDWDGYNALPVRWPTVGKAFELLVELCIAGLPSPDFGAEPDGEITLEWHDSPRRTLSVSVSPEGLLTYSALIGEEALNGTVQFDGGVPAVIEGLIRRVLA